MHIDGKYEMPISDKALFMFLFPLVRYNYQKCKEIEV